MDKDLYKPYKIPNYHWFVWKTAAHDIYAYYRADLRNWFSDIFVALLSGIAYGVYSYLRDEAIVDWLGVFVLAISGFIGYAILSFLFQLVWITPAKLYRDRETEAYKFTWKDIEIKPYLFPSASGIGIGLEIISDKSRNIFNNTSREFSIEVKKLLIEEFGKGMNVSYPRRDLQLLASFNSVVFHETTTIQNRRDLIKEKLITNVVVPIANWDNNHAWIATKDGEKDLLLERDTSYRVVVDFNEWSLEDVNMKYGCAVWCDLHYVEIRDGQMKVKLDIVKRNPDYEK